MPQAVLRLTTLLSPLLYATYAAIARYLGEHLDLTTSLYVGESLAEFTRGNAEVGFLCGLLYVQLRQDPACPVELLAAPILHGQRYDDSPRYFSDVVVRRASPYASFADLHGCTWAFNEQASHSGYNLMLYSLLQRQLALDYFGRSLETGSHLQSLRLVLNGEAETTALDSHLLDVLLEQQPELQTALRVVAVLGPSPIPPLVVQKHLAPDLKRELQTTLLSMHHDPPMARLLAQGQIKRFVAVSEQEYDPLYTMWSTVTSARCTP